MAKIAIVIVIIAIIIIAGIWYYYSTIPPTPPPKKLKIALCISGLVKDPGWPHLGYEALKKVGEKYNAEIAYTEHVNYPDIERVLRDYAEKKFDLIWGHGGEYEEAAPRVAKDYPNLYFMTVGARASEKNLIAFDVKWQEMSYLAGVLAGLVTKTNKIGIISGEPYPPVVAIVEAVKLGAKSVNPNVKFFTVYTGTWIDPEKGKSAALTQIDAGADVILSWADLTALGAIEAARARGVYYIAETQDHYELSKDITIGSIYLNFEIILEGVVKSIIDGTFKGETRRPGIAEGVIDFKVIPEKVPKNIQDKVNEIRQNIINGKIVVPAIYEPTTD
ncbi:MAG: BMP family protein [Candidatus Bathyarchaeia archaeon]